MAKLFGMHTIELHSGVKPEDFERFVVEEYYPSQHWPGVVSHVLKGDRGEREGKYLVMLEFESAESRDRFRSRRQHLIGEAHGPEGGGLAPGYQL